MCLCCGKECGCCGKNAVLFKLSLLGITFSLIMVVIGLFWPFNIILVPIPLSWLLGLFVLIPSITVYYDVMESFWAEITEWHEKKKKGGNQKKE